METFVQLFATLFVPISFLWFWFGAAVIQDAFWHRGDIMANLFVDCLCGGALFIAGLFCLAFGMRGVVGLLGGLD